MLLVPSEPGPFSLHPGSPSGRRPASTMRIADEDSHRRFYCAKCHSAVVLCRRCDRGQRYCGAQCSTAARRESLRRAGRRYLQTVRGRQASAERQRRFRMRRAADVTHQGRAVRVNRVSRSEEHGAHHRETLSMALPVPTLVRCKHVRRTPAPPSAAGYLCSCCQHLCGHFTRWECLSELRQQRRRPTTRRR